MKTNTIDWKEADKFADNPKLKIETFAEELAMIEDEDIKQITEMALLKVHPKFFVAQASSSGKYHPQISLNSGGLVRHVKQTVSFVNMICDQLEMGQFGEIDQFDRDVLVAAAILHDTTKSGIGWEIDGTDHCHPVTVQCLLPEFMDHYLWLSICDTISTHMGQWTTSKYSTITLMRPKHEWQAILHAADYLASRKDMENTAEWFNAEKQQEIIRKILNYEDV
jgi:23S rRNA maturation-related 3'-5' exoribonuclease YhaM